MDSEDCVYLASCVLIGLGAGWLSVGAGLMAFGFMLALPPLVSLFGLNRKKGADK